VNWLVKVAPDIQPDYGRRIAPGQNGAKARAGREMIVGQACDDRRRAPF
jgi:hypothetical protein